MGSVEDAAGVRAGDHAAGRRPAGRRAAWWRAGWVTLAGLFLSAGLAAQSAWHAVNQLPSDVRNYHQWIMGGLPSWEVPGPYPVLADALWWPLRWFHGTNINPWWLLGWTGPATVLICLLLWRTASRPAVAVSVWLLLAGILERSYWLRMEPIAALLTLAMMLGLRRGRIAGSALALSAGALIKVWPAFYLPMALLGRTGRARTRWLTWFALPWVLYGLVVVALRPPGASTWLTFTLTRRTQAESLSALPALWAIVAGSQSWKVVYTSGLDSADLVIGPHLRTAHVLLEGVGLVILAILAVRLGRWLRSRGGPQLGAATTGGGFEVVVLYAQTLLLLVLVFAGPVFSPQYLIWFAPVLVVAVGEGLMVAETAIWLVACVLTSVEFPFLFYQIRKPQPFGVGILTLRDAVLLGLLGLCLRRVWRLTIPHRATGSQLPARMG